MTRPQYSIDWMWSTSGGAYTCRMLRGMSRARAVSSVVHHSGWGAQLGERLRKLRIAQSETLATVGEATGISASFLSLLEQGRTDVSLGRLLPLLDHYGLELSEVIPPRASRGVVSRGSDRQVLFSPAEGIDVSLVVPGHRRPFTPLLVDYRANVRMTKWSQHADDEFIYILSGVLCIEIEGSDSLMLATGDGAFLPPGRNHRMAPQRGEPARALIVTANKH